MIVLDVLGNIDVFDMEVFVIWLGSSYIFIISSIGEEKVNKR